MWCIGSVANAHGNDFWAARERVCKNIEAVRASKRIGNNLKCLNHCNEFLVFGQFLIIIIGYRETLTRPHMPNVNAQKQTCTQICTQEKSIWPGSNNKNQCVQHAHTLAFYLAKTELTHRLDRKWLYSDLIHVEILNFVRTFFVAFATYAHTEHHSSRSFAHHLTRLSNS